jgi:hypothetical protein
VMAGFDVDSMAFRLSGRHRGLGCFLMHACCKAADSERAETSTASRPRPWVEATGFAGSHGCA